MLPPHQLNCPRGGASAVPLALMALREAVRTYWNMRDRLAVDGVLILCGQRVVVPSCLRRDVLQKLHTSHQGKERTKRRARQVARHRTPHLERGEGLPSVSASSPKTTEGTDHPDASANKSLRSGLCGFLRVRWSIVTGVRRQAVGVALGLSHGPDSISTPADNQSPAGIRVDWSSQSAPERRRTPVRGQENQRLPG